MASTSIRMLRYTIGKVLIGRYPSFRVAYSTTCTVPPFNMSFFCSALPTSFGCRSRFTYLSVALHQSHFDNVHPVRVCAWPSDSGYRVALKIRHIKRYSRYPSLWLLHTHFLSVCFNGVYVCDVMLKS
jgi:hypothetical protein